MLAMVCVDVLLLEILTLLELLIVTVEPRRLLSILCFEGAAVVRLFGRFSRIALANESGSCGSGFETEFEAVLTPIVVDEFRMGKPPWPFFAIAYKVRRVISKEEANYLSTTCYSSSFGDFVEKTS
jgi:hypothetical protein